MGLWNARLFFPPQTEAEPSGGDIPVTGQMIEAGLSYLSRAVNGQITGGLVTDLYRVMEASRRASTSQSN
jgi:hypothetical protein